MHSHHRVSAFVFKTQSFSEADEIFTLYTKEHGKLRALAGSTKRSQSRLRFGLQQVSKNQVSLILKGHQLAKITGAIQLQSFSQILEDPKRLMLWYLAVELISKATPDQEPNESLFDLLENFLSDLNNAKIINPELTKVWFKIHIMSEIGTAISCSIPKDQAEDVVFSSTQGGFFLKSYSPGEVVSKDLVRAFQVISESNSSQGLDFDEYTLTKLDQLLTGFIKHYLEREIHSENFLL